MARILVVYASRHGHTEKIAERIAGLLQAAEHTVVLIDHVSAANPSPHHFDLVIAGASIHGGTHDPGFADWARHHSVALNMRPSAFFSVCLTAAEDSEQARAVAHDYLDDFEDRTGWTPRVRATFAGALQYREYGLLTRLLMRVRMGRRGHATDMTRDHDFTNWAAVDAFARRCAALVAPAHV